MKILDVGCGASKREGAVGLDIVLGSKVDVVHELHAPRCPFAAAEFAAVAMLHVIEHVDRPLAVMREIHRISKAGAKVKVVTPHYTSFYSYGDMTHSHHFGYITFKWLEGTGLFRIERKKIHFRDIYKILGVSLFANLFPRQWERYLCFIFPAQFVEVHLRVIKK